MAYTLYTLQRLAGALARGSHTAPAARAFSSLRHLPTVSRESPAAIGAAAAPAAQRWAAATAARRRQRLPLPPTASYSVVSDGSGEPSSSGRGPWKLIIYSKEGCHLCDGLKEKVEALLERAEFLPSALSTAELEVRDITSRPEWEQQYALTIPVLAAAAADGGGEVALPRPSPRFSADALQKHIEKHLPPQL